MTVVIVVGVGAIVVVGSAVGAVESVVGRTVVEGGATVGSVVGATVGSVVGTTVSF
jgi:hypothetical protein